MFWMEITMLIERCRHGDADALGELYKAYAQRMRGVCRRYVSDEQAVDDVLHDAFVIIFTSLDRLRDARKAEAWMMAITRNVASKYKDHLKSLSFVPLEEVEPFLHRQASFEAERVTSDEETTVKGVPLEEVLMLIDRLPGGYGKVFRLSVFEGLSHKEIAAVQGIEPHSSSSQLTRAKKILRKMMQQYWAALLLLLIPLTLLLLKREDDGVYPSADGEPLLPTVVEEKPAIVRQEVMPTDSLRPVIAQGLDSSMPDSLTNMMAQEPTTTDTIRNNEQTDTTHIRELSNLPHNSIADLFPDKSATIRNKKQRWSIDLAYTGGMGEQNTNRPYSFTETPKLAITGEPPSPVTFENWSDYAAFLADNPDGGSSHTRSVIMNIALNNAGDASGTGTDRIIRKSHHYMPVCFSLALRYRLNHRFGLETGLSYSRMRSDFEMGSNGNTINEQQTIHYLGIPAKGICNIYDGKTWTLYGSLGVTAEVPVHSHLGTSYYLHGTLEATDESAIRAPWQWSVGAGLGLQYNITPDIGLFAEPSLHYYSPTGSRVETYRTEHPFDLSLPFGIRFTW